MKNIFKKIGIAAIMLTSVSGCDFNSDLENPNSITPAGADIDLLMNGLQIDFANFYNGAQSAVNPLVRQEAMTGGFRYQTANTPQTVNGVWSNAYAGVMVNADLIIKLAEEKDLTTHLAVAKILKAYTYITLVDIFNDVPLIESARGTEGAAFFNPVADPGADVYDFAITLLDEARVELAKTGAAAGGALARDIYYSGNRARWNAFANTIELKAQVNLRGLRPAAANARIAALRALDLIDTEAENFTYKYGTATQPVSRHPLYRQYYDPVLGEAGGYISNYFLYEMFVAKGVEDPRWRYYFYRQVGSIAEALKREPKALGCTNGALPDHYVTAGVPMFCTFEPGFYGRDHGDGFGIPPDGQFLTCVGVYPAGGRIDNTSTANTTFFGPTQEGQGANGAGIEPIWMAFYTNFLIAEIEQGLGNTAAAKTAMDLGISNSITSIRTFATGKNQILSPGREPSTPNYLAAVDAQFTAAANKMDVIGKEFWIATWGNGIEAYNLYRRTGAPRDFQPTLQTGPGPFFRSYVYPADYVNNNENAIQKDFNITNKVFWDTNTETLN
jgi:hypothetical protein